VVWGAAQEMMEAKGFNDNFSAYVADLIRRDKERQGGEQNLSLKKAGRAAASRKRIRKPLDRSPP
jgi:hypothetical protein